MGIVDAPTLPPHGRNPQVSDVRRSGRHAGIRLRPQQRQILGHTADRLAAGDDPDTEVMPALFEALRLHAIADVTLGFIVCDIAEGLKLGFMHGFDRAMMQRCLTLDFGQAVCGTVAATRQPMHVTDIQRSLDPLADLVRSAGVTAYACEPLIADGHLLGTISFGSRSRRRFEPGEIMLFRSIAKLLAAARARARAPEDRTSAA